MTFFYYCIFQIFRFFISLLPYSLLTILGHLLGRTLFFLHRNYRKKALNTLAIAFGDKLSNKERKKIALRSFQSLLITCLEYCKLKKSTLRFELKANPEVEKLLEEKQPLIFLSAHQANWELPFIALTEKYRGVAIGRPIKNSYLYRYVMSIRQKHKGKIIMPKQAIREGLKALKEGSFLGIVGDQAYPDSSYSYPLFGTKAFTAATPALLAYKANCPLVVGNCKREKRGYIISGSEPIWPNLNAPLKQELPRMMNEAMAILEKNILQSPHEWMWIHERYKQQGINHIKRSYRYSFILAIFPEDPTAYLSAFATIKRIYPTAFLTATILKDSCEKQEGWSFLYYTDPKECYLDDYRYQLIFDFTSTPSLQRHFKRRGAFKSISPKKNERKQLDRFLLQTLVKKECLKTDFL